MPEPWDVVVVPFPYSERLAEKRRPALVVSSKTLGAAGFIWVAMITGAGKQARIGDLAIENLASANLPGPSIVRSSKIATIEPNRVLRTIGKLAPAERADVAKSLSAFLATPL